MKKKKVDVKSRKSAIKSLKSEMRKDGLGPLSEKLDDKMSVKVVSDSPEGLKEGLEKAEDIMEEGGLSDLLKEAFEKKTKKSKKEEE